MNYLSQKTTKFLGLSLIFGLSTAASFFFFTNVLPKGTGLALVGSKTEEKGEKNKPCPLNGEMHTADAESKWKERRPLAVMIENHVDTRPQSGVGAADVVYESVAEGGITRFMAVYLCKDAEDIAPVRSARTYFLDWLSEYDAAYAHVGGANKEGPADAIAQIFQYDIHDLDQFSFGYPTYWRDENKAAPHNVHTTTDRLWKAASDRGWGAKDDLTEKRWDDGFLPWQFKDDATGLPEEQKTHVDFWNNDAYSVDWQYDKATNSYKRFYTSMPSIDASTKSQISPKVVIVMYTKESHANDGYPDNVHLLYKTIGSGKALILQDGVAGDGTWQKDSRTGRTIFKDASGNSVKFNRGQIWIENVPDYQNVKH